MKFVPEFMGRRIVEKRRFEFVPAAGRSAAPCRSGGARRRDPDRHVRKLADNRRARQCANIAPRRATPKTAAAVMVRRARATIRRIFATSRTKISYFRARTTMFCRFDDDTAHALG